MTTRKTGPARAQGVRGARWQARGYPGDLTDAQWQVIVPRLPPEVPGGGAGRVWPVRRIIEAILYLDRTGRAWRYPPADFLSDDVRVLRRLRDNGTLARLHDALRGQVRQAPGQDSEPTPR